MVIGVESVEKMIDDICDFLDIVPEYLEERIVDIADKAASEEDYSQAFLRLSEEFISENTGESISEVYFCHLTRSIDKPSVLLPLKTLLTTNNSFTHFLREYSVEFEIEKNELVMKYNGNPVPRNRVYDPTSWDNDHARLAGRLGWLGTKDFCINGFLHAVEPERSTDDYYRYLMNGPELLQDLDAFFHSRMCDEYCKRSKYFYAIVKIPLKNIIFDERNDLNIDEDRTSIYLSLCFEFLLSWYEGTRYYSRLHNEMLRLDDYAEVSVDRYIELVND